MITISTRDYTTEQLKHLVTGYALRRKEFLKASNANTWKRAYNDYKLLKTVERWMNL